MMLESSDLYVYADYSDVDVKPFTLSDGYLDSYIIEDRYEYYYQYSKLSDMSGKRAVSFAFDLLPIFGEVKLVQESLSGKNLITGEDLSVKERVINLCVLGVAHGLPKVLSKFGGKAIGEGSAISVNPNKIRFSQSSVNGSEEIIASMEKNGWKGAPIDIVEMPDGMYTTIDNTRVVSARKAGIDVKANIHGYNEPLPDEYIERFTTKKGVPTTWGEAIELRVGKQKASFRNGNPFGSFEMENVK